ncbi:hypothetical protein BGZ97_013146 [Linnemannia gamsii]|uniref:Uncharacterized protein n=1 Tax=Linnemannia gamsii TaxID=64522 RepID=A0A9P6QZI8_9FUNG|nr:hypothetical protein BGZ97_013146 [Linnemannia gamsii]
MKVDKNSHLQLSALVAVLLIFIGTISTDMMVSAASVSVDDIPGAIQVNGQLHTAGSPKDQLPNGGSPKRAVPTRAVVPNNDTPHLILPSQIGRPVVTPVFYKRQGSEPVEKYEGIKIEIETKTDEHDLKLAKRRMRMPGSDKYINPYYYRKRDSLPSTAATATTEK